MQILNMNTQKLLNYLNLLCHLNITRFMMNMTKVEKITTYQKIMIHQLHNLVEDNLLILLYYQEVGNSLTLLHHRVEGNLLILIHNQEVDKLRHLLYHQEEGNLL